MTDRVISLLLDLAGGGVSPRGAIPASLLGILIREGLLVEERQGRSRFVCCIRPEALRDFVRRETGAKDLDSFMELRRRKHDGDVVSREEAAVGGGNSKLFGTDVVLGLRLNSIGPVLLEYNGRPFPLDPPPGTDCGVQDERLLSVPESCVLVGVENYSTFMWIRKYVYLFEGMSKLVFVYRVTDSKKSTEQLMSFLERIPNRYLHFGDFDIGGVRLYLNEFKSRLGSRASFFVPDNYESILEHGQRWLSDRQYGMHWPDESDLVNEPRLVDLLHVMKKCRRFVEQESLAKI